MLTYTLHYGVGVFEGSARLRHATRHLVVPPARSHRAVVRFGAHPADRHTLLSTATAHRATRSIRRQRTQGRLSAPGDLPWLGSDGIAGRGSERQCGDRLLPWPDYMDPQSRERGITVRTSSYTRHHVNITMCKAKANGNYINSILALREAQDAGCDEALLLDNEGYVAEGTGENIFVVKNGIIHTPELTSCLPGITRDTILTFAREQGFEIIERRITRDEVYIADEAFFTGTAAEVLPIRVLDGRTIGDGKRRGGHGKTASPLLRPGTWVARFAPGMANACRPADRQQRVKTLVRRAGLGRRYGDGARHRTRPRRTRRRSAFHGAVGDGIAGGAHARRRGNAPHRRPARQARSRRTLSDGTAAAGARFRQRHRPAQQLQSARCRPFSPTFPDASAFAAKCATDC